MSSTKKEQFVELAVGDIIPNKDNPRVINKKGPEFAELVESIRAMGVIVPVHVRDHPKQKGKFDLLAGERRVLAAAEAGRKKIKAINHGKLSDDEAFEITFAENFAREDLSPLEEGKAVAILLLKHKGDAAAVASKMGKSVRWVMQRSLLDKNLSRRWKKEIIEDSALATLTASHLQLIAALPINVQDELLQTDYQYCEIDQLPTVQELEKQISERLMLLSEAPWDLSDSKLIEGAKSCDKCPKRSSYQPGLFDDTTDPEAVKKSDRCLDRNCWYQKRVAFMQMKIAEFRTKYPNLVCAIMPDQELSYYEKQDLTQIFGTWSNQWKASKEGAKDALPALIVYGKNAGDFRWIKLMGTQANESHRGKKTAGKPTPLKERKKLLEKKRWSVVIRKVVKEFGGKSNTDIVNDDKTFTVMALTLVFGTGNRYGESSTWDGFAKLTDHSHVLEALWKRVRKTICENLTWCGPITQTPDRLIESAKCAAKLVGIDINAIFKQVAKDDYPEPKGWKLLNADGTPKKKKNGKVEKAKSKK